MQCIAFAAQLGQNYPMLQENNTQVLVIGGGGVSRAEVLAKTSRLPFPVLADSDRSVYEDYLLGKKLLMIQQSGLVVVDRNGVIRHYRRYTNPTEWLGTSEIDSLKDIITGLDAAPS